jgi:hypothetical protein
VVKKEIIMVAQKLSPIQLELLKVYSFSPSNEDVLAVKEMLARYFSNKMINKIGQAVEENNISEEDLSNWLHEND